MFHADEATVKYAEARVLEELRHAYNMPTKAEGLELMKEALVEFIGTIGFPGVAEAVKKV